MLEEICKWNIVGAQWENQFWMKDQQKFVEAFRSDEWEVDRNHDLCMSISLQNQALF
jgi:hypothetical protein